jgi:hypothetical protein
MHPTQSPPTVRLEPTSDYRENYCNSVQIRASLWDFFLLFGTMQQNSPEAVTIRNFTGIYFSPQQAKALLNVLQQNIQQYETTFGEIRLEPKPGGVIQ